MNQIRRFWVIDDKGEDAKAGWFAWYVFPRKPYVFSQPLIGWALTTRDKEDYIVGIVANVNEIIEADRPTGGEKFVMYMQRGSWSQEQIDVAERDLREMGKRLEREEEARRNSPEMGTGGVLQASRKDGASEVHQRAVRILQDEIEGGGTGVSSDAPQEPPLDVEE